MAEHWDDPWGSAEEGRRRDWRRDDHRGGEWTERWRGAEDGRRFDPDARHHGERERGGWRDPARDDPWRRPQLRPGPHPDEPRYGSGGYGNERERWRTDVERYPGRQERWDPPSRGTLEREDRGPLQWLGDKLGEVTRGRGPKGYRRSDERIQDEVCERIARSGIDADEVDVKVEKGNVTLTGFVRSRAEKRLLEDLADDVFGVEEVHNQLRLTRPAEAGSTPPAPAPPATRRH